MSRAVVATALILAAAVACWSTGSRREPQRCDEEGWSGSGPVVVARRSASARHGRAAGPGADDADAGSRPGRVAAAGPIAMVRAALSRRAFAEAERSSRQLIDQGGLDEEAAGWARYHLAEALFNQGRLDEARVQYEALIKKNPSHRAAPNAEHAVQFIREWPRYKVMLAGRRSEP